jgi:hypothetical protein
MGKREGRDVKRGKGEENEERFGEKKRMGGEKGKGGEKE